MNFRPFAIIGGLVICGQASIAHAAACGVDAQPLAFGSFNTLDSQPHDTTADISVTCQATGAETVNYDISLSTGGAGSYSERTLLSGAEVLDYNIYKDGSRSIVWGDGSSFTETISDSMTFTGAGQEINNHTAYGRVLGNQQTAMIGSYVDTITITMTY